MSHISLGLFFAGTATAAAASQPTVSVSVDAAGGAEPFPHNWQRSFGSGHALLATRADWQAQLKRAVAEIGLRGVRMHGLLDDDMSVMLDAHTYSWYNVDKVFDFLVAEGVTPIVELSFMPSAIAANKEAYSFANRGGYKGLNSPPSDYNAWYDLIHALGTHLVARYGVGEVSRWSFEVWNEMWGMPYPTAYVPLYNASARALKAVHPSLIVGGPSSANLADIPELIADAAALGVPLDFVSSHHYPSDPSCSHAGPHAGKAECFSLDVLAAAAVATNASKPFYLTEYKDGLQGGPGTGFGGRHGDTAYAAAFVVHTLPRLTSLDLVSWWTFSDIFEENWMIGKPFYGGFGLLTIDGVAKPAYRAFELLAGAGTRRLTAVTVDDAAPGYMNESTISAFATLGDARGVGDALQIFVANFGPEEGASPAPWSPVPRNVSLSLAGVHAKGAMLRRIDDATTAPYDAWAKLGSPPYPTAAQVEAVAAASQMSEEWLPLEAAVEVEGPLARAVFEVPAYGVAHLTIAAA